jgi:hypothetical protein
MLFEECAHIGKRWSDKWGRILLGMGVNLSQEVSDEVYSDFVEGRRSVFVVQSNEYYKRKLRGKKYIRLVNEEKPEKPMTRFRIESVEEGHGGAQEDIYGQHITGTYLKITVLKRQKTK